MCLDLVFHCVANNILILSVACPVASGPCAAIYLIKMNVHRVSCFSCSTICSREQQFGRLNLCPVSCCVMNPNNAA